MGGCLSVISWVAAFVAAMVVGADGLVVNVKVFDVDGEMVKGVERDNGGSFREGEGVV